MMSDQREHWDQEILFTDDGFEAGDSFVGDSALELSLRTAAQAHDDMLDIEGAACCAAPPEYEAMEAGHEWLATASDPALSAFMEREIRKASQDCDEMLDIEDIAGCAEPPPDCDFAEMGADDCGDGCGFSGPGACGGDALRWKALLRDAARHEAALNGPDALEEFLKNERDGACDDPDFDDCQSDSECHPECGFDDEYMFLDYDDWLDEVSEIADNWDKNLPWHPKGISIDYWEADAGEDPDEDCDEGSDGNCDEDTADDCGEESGKFVFSDFRARIFKSMLTDLKTDAIMERFGGVFEGRGRSRRLLYLDEGRFTRFVEGLRIRRLDRDRVSWAEYKARMIDNCESGVSEDRPFVNGVYPFDGLAENVIHWLTSDSLKNDMRARVAYDSENDCFSCEYDRDFVNGKLDAVIDTLNGLRPLSLKMKALREQLDAARVDNKRLAQRNTELERACEKAWDKADRLEKEAAAKAEAERVAAEKSEAESIAAEEDKVEPVAPEEEVAESITAEEAEAERARKERESQGRLEDPDTRDEEIERLRQEWEDADMDMEDEILALKNELAPAESDFRYWEEERKSLDDRIERDYRIICEEDSSARGRGYQLKPALETARYKNDSINIEKNLKRSRREYEDGLEEIAEAERERGRHKRKYEALIARYGASLDRSIMSSSLGLADQPPSGKAAKLDFVLPGLPKGMFGLCAGGKAVGKTQMLTQELAGICCGRQGTKGSVIRCCGEDDEGALEARFASTLDHFHPRLAEAERADIEANFQRFYLEKMGVDLTDAENEGALAFIRMLRRWARGCRERGAPARAIVLDSLANFTAGKENQPESMAAFIETLKRISADTGASIIIVHHTTKGSRNGGELGAEDARGHSILAYTSKWFNVLTRMTEKEAAALGIDPAERKRFVKSSFPDCNYLPPREPQWWRMDEQGVLVPAGFGESFESVEYSVVSAEPEAGAPLVQAEPESGAEVSESENRNFNWEADHG